MARKRIGQIDLSTGEVLEGVFAYVVPRRRNGFGKRWVAMAQSAAMIFAQRRKELGEEGFAVLLMLIAKLDFENLLLLNQAEIAKQLGMHRQNVQRSIKKLIEMGALLPGPKVGVSRSYRLNPEFGWKGSSQNHVVALDEYRQKRLSQARQGESLSSGEPSSDSE